MPQTNLQEVTVTARRPKPFDWQQFANNWWPGYSLGTCIYSGCTGSGWLWAGIGGLPLPEGKALQTGGRVLSNATARALNELAGTNLAGREWGRALEALKADFDLPNDFHGAIMGNGDFVNPNTGETFGNIQDYIP